MAGFDAATAVDAMDWNFEKFGGGSGTVPEPSNAQMKKFQDDFSRIMREGAKLDKSSNDIAEMPEEDFEMFRLQQDEISDRLDAAIANLCQDRPSADQVSKLPFRVKTAFSKWLMEQFRPESEASATKK